MDMELDNIIVLTDDDGNDVEFEFLDLICYEDKEYVVLLPVAEDSDEVMILQAEDLDEETERYTGVEDEAVLMAVFEIFKEKFQDEFTFAE